MNKTIETKVKLPCLSTIQHPCETTPPVTINAAEPMPSEGSGPAIWDLVREDLALCVLPGDPGGDLIHLMIQESLERDRQGEAKYKRRLRDHDGRDPLIDAVQEAMDLSVYLRKDMEGIRKRGIVSVLDDSISLYYISLKLWMDLRAMVRRRTGR